MSNKTKYQTNEMIEHILKIVGCQTKMAFRLKDPEYMERLRGPCKSDSWSDQYLLHSNSLYAARPITTPRRKRRLAQLRHAEHKKPYQRKWLLKPFQFSTIRSLMMLRNAQIMVGY